MKKLFEDDERNEIVEKLKTHKKFVACFLDKKGASRYVYSDANSFELVGMLDSVKHSLLSKMREQLTPEERD